MAFLEGLPPLPKSLSNLNLPDCNVFQGSTNLFSIPADTSILRNDSYNQNFPMNSEGNNVVVNSSRRNYPMSAFMGSESNISNRTRTSPLLRDGTSGLTYKQITDTSPVSSSRVSPVINSSRSTPHGSSRGSPNIIRGSTPPMQIARGSTPPMPGIRNLTPGPTSPRQNSGSINMTNGMEMPLHARPGRSFNLDTQLATLRKEMFSLRQMDLSLLNQLWSLNEAIQDLRHIQEENASTFPPSPGSCDDSDEFYSPLSTLRYQNISNFQLPSFAGRLSSSSESSIEFGDV